MANDLKVGDICIFWNNNMKFPFLSKLIGFSDGDTKVYYSQTTHVEWIEGISSGEYSECNEFYNCQKVAIQLPKIFKGE